MISMQQYLQSIDLYRALSEQTMRRPTPLTILMLLCLVGLAALQWPTRYACTAPWTPFPCFGWKMAALLRRKAPLACRATGAALPCRGYAGLLRGLGRIHPSQVQSPNPSRFPATTPPFRPSPLPPHLSVQGQTRLGHIVAVSHLSL